MLEVAVAVRLVAPVMDAPAAGAVTVTTGGGRVTETFSAAVVVCRPRLSVARAVRVAAPEAVGDHEIEYGAVASVPSETPFAKNSTDAMVPTADDAVAVIVVVLEIVAPAAGEVISTEGGATTVTDSTAEVV
jgi:hypothetical protein